MPLYKDPVALHHRPPWEDRRLEVVVSHLQHCPEDGAFHHLHPVPHLRVACRQVPAWPRKGLRPSHLLPRQQA